MAKKGSNPYPTANAVKPDPPPAPPTIKSCGCVADVYFEPIEKRLYCTRCSKEQQYTPPGGVFESNPAPRETTRAHLRRADMKKIDNSDYCGNMNDDYAVFFLHGEKVAEVKNPHAGIAVGEKVRIAGEVYNVEKVIQDIEEFTTECYVSCASCSADGDLKCLIVETIAEAIEVHNVRLRNAIRNL